MRTTVRHRRMEAKKTPWAAIGILAALALALGSPAVLNAQVQAALVVAPVPTRPFFLGERLEYRVRLSGVGMSGRGAMWVDGPEIVRGVETYVLHFGIKAHVGPIRVSDATQSWLDPRHMASLRFVKRERHPFSSNDQDVAMYPDEQRWSAVDGAAGESMTTAPLDELSFIYFLRTVPLAADSVYRFDRHFDAARNPTVVRVIGRDSITVGAGRFATVIVEMRVKDPERYQGDGVIRIYFTDDERRLPVRIESTIPRAGTATMTLESLPSTLRRRDEVM